MKIVETALPEVRLIEPRVHEDARGLFLESWNAREFAEAGIDAGFVQDNQSRSARGVLRGLHYQRHQPQGKLVRVGAGRAFDVALDIRRSSPRFGQHVGVEISAENRRMLWIPPGFAHGFLALEEGTEFLYKCTDYYAPEHERTILWSDPALAIDWPLDGIGQVLVSPKDSAGALLADADLYP
jgi:dTDP-4-dehydrorhamnose 3,5-epimerase